MEARRGAPWTSTVPMPCEASSARAPGVRTRPRSSNTAPPRVISPCRRMWWGPLAPRGNATRPASATARSGADVEAVSSTGTTRTVPAGTGAPVMMRTAVPARGRAPALLRRGVWRRSRARRRARGRRRSRSRPSPRRRKEARRRAPPRRSRAPDRVRRRAVRGRPAGARAARRCAAKPLPERSPEHASGGASDTGAARPKLPRGRRDPLDSRGEAPEPAAAQPKRSIWARPSGGLRESEPGFGGGHRKPGYRDARAALPLPG